MHGGDVYRNKVKLDFSININPLGMPEGLREHLCAKMDLLEQYPDPYCEALKEHLAKYHSISSTNILCANGASELIHAITTQSKNAILCPPCFLGYKKGLREYTSIPRVSLQVNTKRLKQEINKGIYDLCILTNPNNPDGSLLSLKTLLEIVKTCEKNKVILLVDECFMELCEEDVSLISYIDQYKYLLLLRAFTKSMAIPGIRLGYCISSNTKLLEKISTHLPEWNVSTLAQEAGIYCVEQKEYLKCSRAFIQKERNYLYQELSKLGIEVFPSQTNFLLFFIDKEIKEPLLKKGILIRDCSDYDGLQAGYYRIAIKKHEENEILLCALKEIIHESN